MSYEAIEYSLFDAVRTWALSEFLPVAWPNVNFDPPSTAYARVFIVSSQPAVVTIGTRGEDEYNGFVQLSLFMPTDQGSGETTRLFESLRGYFSPGQYFDTVFITRSPQRQSPRYDNSRYRTDITVFWSARVQRPLPSPHPIKGIQQATDTLPPPPPLWGPFEL